MTLWLALAWSTELDVRGPRATVAGEAVTLTAEGSDDTSTTTWWRRSVVAGPYDNVAACGAPVRGCAEDLPITWSEVHRGPSWTFRPDAGAWLVAATDGPPPRAEARPHRLAVRADDTYVGHLHELIGVPFVFGPAWLDGGHQTDELLAVDCVALVIYGQRRRGHLVPYVSPHALAERLTPVDGRPARVGDVLHWGWQTAVLAEDRPPVGTVDRHDHVIVAHEGHLAERVLLGDLPFAGQPFARFRWPEATTPTPVTGPAEVP